MSDPAFIALGTPDIPEDSKAILEKAVARVGEQNRLAILTVYRLGKVDGISSTCNLLESS